MFEQIEAALLDVGVDFSPCTLDALAARIRAAAGQCRGDARLLLDASNFETTQPATAAVPAKHHFALGGGEATVDIGSLIDEARCLAPFGRLAAWSGPRRTPAQRTGTARVCMQLAKVAELSGIATGDDDVGKADAVHIANDSLAIAPRIDSLERALGNPAADISERADLVSGDSTRARRGLAKRLPRVITQFTNIGTVLDGAAPEEVFSLLELLSTGLGRAGAVNSLGACDAIEAALADGPIGYLNQMGVDRDAAARVAAVTAGVKALRQRVDMALVESASVTSSTRQGNVAALLRGNQDLLNRLLLSPEGVAAAARIREATTHVAVLRATFDSRLTALAQIALGKGITTSNDPTVAKIAAARTALPRYLGAALYGDDQGGESFCASDSLVEALRTASLRDCPWHHEIVAKRDTALFGVNTDGLSLEDALNSARESARLAEQGGRFFAALGFDAEGDLRELVEHARHLFDHAPPGSNATGAMQRLVWRGLDDMAETFADFLRQPPDAEYPPSLWSPEAPSRAIFAEAMYAFEEENRRKRVGMASLGRGQTSRPGARARPRELEELGRTPGRDYGQTFD
ncbi:hypothetical protein M885DRAFT_44228 [Pelagophyceae sp. CCMP2097]|nr:hypothetical protein M885DRAFT_44228 [Pelagophyceae sp. CCMP2097]